MFQASTAANENPQQARKLQSAPQALGWWKHEAQSEHRYGGSVDGA
jgi:hypothetical protein